MKVRFNRWYNAVLTALLSMLGYSCSMDEPDEYGPIVVEYGVPHAYYEVKGVVSDEAGTPVEGIKTSVKYVSRNSEDAISTYGIDSVQTDAAGRYDVKFNGFPGRSDIKLIVEDIDGDANGSFKNDTVDIDYKNAVKTENGDGAWNDGTFTITQDIKLKKK